MTKQRATWCNGVIVAFGLVVAAAALPHGKDPWPAPEEVKKLKNPVPASEATLATAKALFFDRCAQCHGESGKGDGPEAPMYSVKPADLTDAHMMGEMTDGEIFWKISEGRRPMPTFKKLLTEGQRWQLVNYLRTLASKPPATPAATPAGKKRADHKHD